MRLSFTISSLNQLKSPYRILFIFSEHLRKIFENIYQRLLTRFVKLAPIYCFLFVIAAELQQQLWVYANSMISTC